MECLCVRLNIHFGSIQIILCLSSLSSLLSRKDQPLKFWSNHIDKHTNLKMSLNRTQFSINSTLSILCLKLLHTYLSLKRECKLYLPSAYLFGIWPMRTCQKIVFSIKWVFSRPPMWAVSVTMVILVENKQNVYIWLKLDLVTCYL